MFKASNARRDFQDGDLTTRDVCSYVYGFDNVVLAQLRVRVISDYYKFYYSDFRRHDSFRWPAAIGSSAYRSVANSARTRRVVLKIVIRNAGTVPEYYCSPRPGRIRPFRHFSVMDGPPPAVLILVIAGDRFRLV